jgi:DNA-binding MarR family transcriptional regulator
VSAPTQSPATATAERMLDGPKERLGRSFKATMGSVRRLRGRETHKPGALSFAQYGLLFGLEDKSELPTRELAVFADLSAATATQMLDHLEASGLVARVRSEHDRRVVLVSLTTSGRAAIGARKARFQTRWEAALADFSDAELVVAAAVLDRLSAMFDEIPAE